MKVLQGVGLAAATVLGTACAPDARLDDEGEGLARAALGPPVLSLLDPPAGAPDVPPNLAQVVLRAPRALSAGSLAGAVRSTPAVPVTDWSEVPCPGEGHCYLGRLTTALAPDTAFAFELSGTLTFVDGAPVTGGPLGRFRTAARPDDTPPNVSALAVEELAGCARIRLHADEPVFVKLALASGADAVVRPRGGPWTDTDAVLGARELPSGGALDVAAEVWDRAGNVSRAPPVRLDRAAALPPLAITEVLANPAGPEATQEFVEIRNLSSGPVSLAGLLLADSGGADALPTIELQGGAYVVLVPAGYDAAAAAEVPPRPGTLIVRVDGRLGRDGLGNAGEAVLLRRGSDGAVVSRYGGWVDSGGTPGRSVHRVPQDACDVRSSWSSRAEAPTPGW